MQTDMSYTETEDLFEAYHSAVNSVGFTAVPLYKRAVEDCEDAVLELLEDWDNEDLRLASTGLLDDRLEDLLWEVLDGNRWVFMPYQAQAVYDGADRLGIAAELVEGCEDHPEPKAMAILRGVLSPQLRDMADNILQPRLRWAMENR
jgi:hypothetical protein